MHKFLAVGLVATLAAVSAQGRVICSGDSASVVIDSRVGARESTGDETITYSSLWDGGEGATVTIAQDGAVLAAGLTGEGEQAWSVEQNGTYTLTHTTFTNGVAGTVETAVFVVTGKGVPFEEGDVTVTGYSGTYDGAAHGATVSVAAGIDGAAVKYASGAWGTSCPLNGWSSNPPMFTDVGEYAVWCVVSAPGYASQMTMVAVSISPYDIGGAVVTLGEGLTYNGGVQTQTVASVTSGGFAVTYDTSGDVATNAGDYVLTVTGTGNFTGTATAQFTVARKDIAGAEIATGASLTYNGAEQAQAVTSVTVDGLNATYAVSGNRITDAGAYVLTVTGTGNFTGTATKQFTVARKDIAGAVIALGIPLTYNGAEQAQTISAVTADGLSATYTTSGNTGMDAGTYTLTVTGTGNFTGTATKQYAIARKDIAGAEIALGAPLTYTGTEQVQVVSGVTVDGLNVTYMVGGNTATDAGTYTLAATGTGNFTGTATKQFTVSRKDISEATITLGASLAYTGAEQTQVVTGVAVDGLNATYTVSGNNVTDAGTHTLTVTGTGNFTGTATVQFTVAGKDVAGADITLGAPLTYNGVEQIQAVSDVTVDGLAATYTVSGNAATDAGTYTLTVTGTGNFTGTATKQYTIARKDIAGAEITLGSSLTYNGAEQAQAVTGVTVDGLDATYTVSGNVATDAGTYSLTVAATGNFTGTATKQFVVARKDIAGAEVALGAPLTYNGAEQAQAVTGVTLDGLDVTYIVSENTATSAGTHLLTVTGTGNFSGTATKQYTVARKDITGAVIALGAPLVYTGAELTQAVTGVTVGGLEATCAVSGNTATDAGTYTLTVTGTGNFTGMATRQWRIYPAEIIAEVIPYEGVYDGEGHCISVSVTTPVSAVVKYGGGAPGDEWTTVPPAFTNVSTVTVWYMVEAENYVTITNNGTVTILPKTLTDEMVTLETRSCICDGTAKVPPVAVADGEPSILTVDDYDVAYSNNVEIGTATVTVTGKGNYTGTVTKTFEITPDSFTGGGATWQYVARNGAVEIVGASVTGDVVVIPDEIGGVPVTTLLDGCLAGDVELKGVVVGCNVTNLGARAFAGCENLLVVVFRGDAPEDIDQGLQGASQGLEVYYENGTPGCPELSISPVTSIRNGRTAVTISRGTWSNVVTVRYTTDGSDPVSGSAIYRSRFSVNVTALTVVRAAAFLGDVRVGRIVEVRYSQNLGDLLDVAPLILQDGSAPVSFAVDTAHPWWSDEDEDSLDGTPSMRSGAIEHNMTSWMSATFEGEGVFEFSWKTSCEWDDLGEYWYDHAVCELDGVAVAWLDDETDWTLQTLTVTNGGVHTVTWSYVKDDDDDVDAGYEDCAWVDGVKFSRKVTVSFAPGGASGMVPANVVSAAGYTVILPGQGDMAFAKHAFGGWSDGTNNYAGGVAFDVPGTDVTLTAVWMEKRLAAPTISVAGTYDGISTPVSITADAGASIWYTLDGSEPSPENGCLYDGAFDVEGTMTVKAVATRDDWFDSEVSVARTARSWGTLNECLDNQHIDVSTSGDASWYGVAMATATNGTALRSGVIGDGQESRLYVGISGEGELSFRWKVSSEAFKQFQVDYVSFSIDGTEMAWIGGEVDWTNLTFAISGTGDHLLRWTYKKDGGGRSGEDCAWLDGVVWSPSAPAGIVVDAGGNKTVIVPTEWIVAHPALVTAAGGDAVAAVRNGTAANGRKVWECYVLGLDPEVANDFKITTFPMKADGTPDLANIAFTPPQAQWNVPGARPVVQGAAALDSEWQVVTEENKAGFRFFKVVVELP